MVFRETRDKRTLCPNYLGIDNDVELTHRIAACQLRYFCGDDGVLPYHELLAKQIILSLVGYGRLSNALNCFFDRFKTG
jgi:hypothetical protein